MARTTRARTGLTLLELVLAVSLTVLIFITINMAMQLNTRAVRRQTQRLEQAQLARAILRRLADDLRGTVQYTPIDFSQLAAMNAGAIDNAISQATGGAGGATAPTGGGGGGGATSGAGSGGAGGGASPGGSTGGGAGSGGGSTSAVGTSGMGSSTTGSSTTGGATAGSTASATENIAENTTPPQKMGLYGNESELMIDVSRLPRPDEYFGQANASQDPNQAMSIPSDVKTVAYFVRQGTQVSADASLRSTARASEGGLVRRELDRAVTLYSSQGGSSNIANVGRVVASEVVAVQFSYFDGTQYVSTWDSTVNQGLPKAVLITIYLQPPDDPSQRSVGQPSAATDPTANAISYRYVVNLPLADSTQPSSGAASDATGTTGTGTSGKQP